VSGTGGNDDPEDRRTDGAAAKNDKQRDREARLAAALRENLHRRNAQRRAKAAPSPESGDEGES
jgi:hypothetical protein